MNILDQAPLLSAHDLMKAHGSTNKYGVLRMKKSGLHLGKWTYRFLVLTRHFLYVYKNEQASSPKAVLRLRDFRQVQSFESDGCASWCFSLVTSPHASSRGDSARGETFSCVSEEDRKGWVAALLMQISLAADELGLMLGPGGTEPASHTYEDMKGARDEKSTAGPATTSHVRKGPALNKGCVNQLSTAARNLSQPMVYLATEDLKSTKSEAVPKTLKKGIFPDSLDIPEPVQNKETASEDLISRISLGERSSSLTSLHKSASDSIREFESESEVEYSNITSEPRLEESIPLRNNSTLILDPEDTNEDYVNMNSPAKKQADILDSNDNLYVNYNGERESCN